MPLLKDKIIRKDYQERALYEWSLLGDLEKKYVSFLLSSGIKTSNTNNSGLLFALGITDEEPLEKVARFNRGGLCDIDMDFCEVNRYQVVEYVRQKYGEQYVAHIGTFGAMKAKSSIRDITRVLGYPYSIGDKLSRLILPPIEGVPQSLQTCLQKVPELANFRKQNGTPESEILYWAEQLEDRLRTFGTHAAGIIIAANPISEKIPLYRSKDEKAVTQYEMHMVEKIGLVKFDFLGLRALTTMKFCTDLIKQLHKKDINLLEIPTDDSLVYQMLQQGDTEGLFQLENSGGIHDLLVKVKPTCLEDMSLVVSLFRPGPLSSGMVDNFVKIRSGLEEPKYLVPDLKKILSKTEGQIVYQEQVLEICRQLAGYSLADADIMRHSMGKKVKKEMAFQQEKFILGMTQQGHQKEIAEQLFDQIEKFAGYVFNKSHAVSYAYISYQMAWLKTHYPLEFMCACLTTDSDETDKIIRYINYCQTRNIKILPPDVNASEVNFSIDSEQKAIRFGLSAIKNLGKTPVKEILKEKRKNGQFKDLIDFINRIDIGLVNKRKAESLVLAGTFDSISNLSRSSLLEGIANLWDHKEEVKRYEAKLETFQKRSVKFQERQNEILSGTKKRLTKTPVSPPPPTPPQIPIVEEMDIHTKLAHEKDLMGYFISGHPLDFITEKQGVPISEIKENGKHKQRFEIIAIASAINEITTKKNKQKMAFLTLEDKTGTLETVLWPKTYHEYEHLLHETFPMRYICEIEVSEEDVTKIVKAFVLKVEMLNSIKEFLSRPLSISVPLSKMNKVANIIKENKGENFRADIQILSADNTHSWKVGPFFCRGSKDILKKKIDGEIR